jgi:hypothetical protein
MDFSTPCRSKAHILRMFYKRSSANALKIHEELSLTKGVLYH